MELEKTRRMIYINRQLCYKSDSTAWSDRLYEEDSEKYDRAYKAVWGNTGQMFYNRKPEEIERFLSLYLGKTVVLTTVIQETDVSNGYPYWVFRYRAVCGLLKADEYFAGNVDTGTQQYMLDDLNQKSIKYRLEDTAYDIQGNRIGQKDTKALIIKGRSSLDKYNNWMQETITTGCRKIGDEIMDISSNQSYVMRKIKIEDSMTNEFVIILTDVPDARVKAWVDQYREKVAEIRESKTKLRFDTLARGDCVTLLYDSAENQEINKEAIAEIIGYDESYDLNKIKVQESFSVGRKRLLKDIRKSLKTKGFKILGKDSKSITVHNKGTGPDFLIEVKEASTQC